MAIATIHGNYVLVSPWPLNGIVQLLFQGGYLLLPCHAHSTVCPLSQCVTKTSCTNLSSPWQDLVFEALEALYLLKLLGNWAITYLMDKIFLL
jgi:hypothetical protein